MTYSQTIVSDLTLRALKDEADKNRFAAFSAIYNNPGEGATCACLAHHHPEMTLDDFWVVEPVGSGEIVSTTCLIPWKLRFAGVELHTAQLEMVLTHPEYRGRGLVRTQMLNFERVVKERNFDLSIIWGIPYYYRQYGYAYTIAGATCETLPVWRIPAASLGEALPLRLRPAVRDDIPSLTLLYHQSFDRLALSAERSPEYWFYLLEAAHHPVEMVEHTASGEALGYVVIDRSAATAAILESSLPDALIAQAVLQLLKGQFSEQLQISWPADLPLAALARQLGSQTVPGGQWLVRIPSMERFLGRLGPVFEQRLAGSDWSGISASITLNLFRQAFRLCFEHGRWVGVDSLGFVDSSMGADGGHLCIPPEAFLRLLFGYRGLDELFDAWPDILVKPEAQPLIQALFPRLQPFLYTPYHDRSLHG